MRRESHRLRVVARRRRSGPWGHRSLYVGAVLATGALIAGFGSAILIYAPIGTPFRHFSGSTEITPPVGVYLGTDLEVIATKLPLTNAVADTPAWAWTNASGAFTGPCNASGVLNQSTGSYEPFTTPQTGEFISSGNVTLVCLNSVGPSPLWPYGGQINTTWYVNATDVPLTTNTYDFENFMANGSTYTGGGADVVSCNSWTAAPSMPAWESPWNLTHVDNSSFQPCSTYYEENNNTTWLPSFDGQYLGMYLSGPYEGLPEYANSTVWAPDEFGYGPSDLVYTVPITFTTQSTNGTYEVSVAIVGVTPVAQTFFFNNTAHGGTFGPATVLITFDMSAAWLYDATYAMDGLPSASAAPEIYGGVGVASVVVTECTMDYVCPGSDATV